MNKNNFVYVNRTISYEEVSIYEFEVGIVVDVLEDGVLVDLIRSNIEAKLPISVLVVFEPSMTGDGFSKKVCNVCHRLLDTTNFDKNQNGKDNRSVRRPSCKECRVHIDGVNVSGADRRAFEAKKPELERFTCPVCKKTTIPGLTSKVVLDHNHETGKVRGWICDSCNTGLGRFKDNIELIKSALNYITSQD